MNKDIYICKAYRTPIGSLMGSLGSVTATDLGAGVIKACLKESEIKEKIDDLILGCVLTAGLGQAPARQAGIKAGLANSVNALTVNKVCSSGLKAITLACDKILLGKSQSVIAGGMESMTNAPYLLSAMRKGARMMDTTCVDSMMFDGLTDSYGSELPGGSTSMGVCGELCAQKYNLTRQQQDEYAVSSYKRSQAATKDDKFKDEIIPVEVKSRRETTLVSQDDEPFNVKFDKISNLRPAFLKDGTVTAANASSINDGAAAVLLCTKEFADENGLTPLAKVIAYEEHSQDPAWFTTAPIEAAKKTLASANIDLKDIDLFEVNEAFSSVAMAFSKELGINESKVNVNGGAVSLGHPIGASGARILVTLIHALKNQDKKRGLAAICNGGGEATSICIERI